MAASNSNSKVGTLVPPNIGWLVENEKKDPAEIIHGFATEANATYREIIESSQLNTSQKYKCLKGLKGSIKEVKVTYPEEFQRSTLVGLASSIHKARKELRRTFTTNSHWLSRTMQGKHMVEVQPSVRKNPSVKLSLNSIETSLGNIAELPHLIDKIRALQYLSKMITDELNKLEQALKVADQPERITQIQEKIEYLKNKQELVINFGDRYLTFQEKISLLLEINKWDQDPIQELELKELVDKYGRNFASYFLVKKEMTLGVLFDSLVILLKEVHDRNPSLTFVEIVQEWPNTLSALNMPVDVKGLNVKSLIALSQDPGFLKNPCSRIVQEYLLNLIDGDGSIRLKELQSKAQRKKISQGEYFRQVGQLIYVLRCYHYPYEHLFNSLEAKKQKVKEITPFAKVLALMSAGIGGAERTREIQCLADSIRSFTVSIFMSAITEKNLSDSQRVRQLSSAYASQHEKLGLCVFRQVAEAETQHERVCRIANFMNLAYLLAYSGNFYPACVIMNNVAKIRYESELKPSWEEYKTLNCFKNYTFLENIFTPMNNWRNYQDFLADRERKSFLCTPMLNVFMGQLDKFHEISLYNRSGTTELIITELLTSDELDEVCRQLYVESSIPTTSSNNSISDKKDKEWMCRHLLDDPAKLLQVFGQIKELAPKMEKLNELVLQYIESSAINENDINSIHRSILACCFALKAQFVNQPVVNVSREFLELINQQVPAPKMIEE